MMIAEGSRQLLHAPPHNRVQRSGHDKVRVPDRCANFSVSDYAPQSWRAVADTGR